MYYLRLLFIATLAPFFLNGQTLHTVRPNDADPESSAPNNFHLAYISEITPHKNKLFLFFPGTGGVPFLYREILKHAANLGYHSIGLTYPNDEAINQICLTSTDTTCHSRARLEIFDGIDRHSEVNVDEYNCIERRVLKLLEFLDDESPNENWGQFISEGEILWEHIIVSGHSQGGGHAGIISKIKKVERVVMFAAMDWMPILNRNADWITWIGETEESNYYGLAHEEDEMVNFSTLLTTWQNYGMANFGSKVLVDTTTTPFNNSLQLYTQLTPANDPSKFHGAMVADSYTPIENGQPILRTVWTYMLEGNDEVLSTEGIKFKTVKAYPNPVSSKLSLDCLGCDEAEFEVRNTQGKLLNTGNVSNKEIDFSELPKGMYILSLSKNNHPKYVIKVLKE